MARRFLTNIDLNSNEIQNVVIHKLAVAPASPTQGQIYFNTTDERYYLRQLTNWKDVTGRLDDILSATTALTVTDNNDGTLTLAILDATGSTSGLMSSADKALLDAATSANTPSTLVLRDASGNFSAQDITTNSVIINSDSVTWGITNAVTKGYVDNLVSTGIKFLGTIDCSLDPDYPVAVTGDAYIAQPGGKIGGAVGPDVEQGDWIICINDNAGGDQATVGADWDIVQSNITDATETVSGKVRVATQAEVNAGVIDGAVSISPAKLQIKLDALPFGANKFAVDIGDGSATSYVITHNLNDIEIQMSLLDNANGDQVECDMRSTGVNDCLYQFTQAPGINAFKAIITG